MKKIADILGKKVLVADGAMGTLLYNRISGHFYPEELNLSQPSLIEEIHREYALSGASFITTNTFGANPLKLQSISLAHKFEKINKAAVHLARKVADEFEIWVAGNISACGQLLEPLGPLAFSQAVKNFSDQARILTESGCDCILLETITEIQEFRAAVIGILSSVNIPVFANMSFTNQDRSISGSDGQVLAISGDFSDLAAIGANCGTTLEAMKKVMKQISSYTGKPLMCKPNSRLPVVDGKKEAYIVESKKFAEFIEEMYLLGVAIVGSCCGSTPAYTQELSRRFKNKPVLKRKSDETLVVSSRTDIKEVSTDKVFLIGERINPTGRKKLQAELMAGKLGTIRMDTLAQEKQGCDALDININLHQLPITTVKNVIFSVQNLTSLPLIIDSTDIKIIEEFCLLYAGKGIINSISGEKTSLTSLLPLVKKYNMAFIAALLDERGIPTTAHERVKIAQRIVKRSLEMGIALKNIIFDPLVISAGAEPDKVSVSLATLRMLKQRYPGNRTVMGLSNISYGLPSRDLINASFLSMAVAAGLDMVIANPLSDSLRQTLIILDFLSRPSQKALSRYLSTFTQTEEKSKPLSISRSKMLYDSIMNGDMDGAGEQVEQLLTTESALDIVNRYVIPAMNEVGDRYEKKIYFLPQLIAAADVVKTIFPLLKKNMPSEQGNHQEKIIFATVKGDIHDIGKNIVVSILEGFNFEVADLGKDIDAGRIIEEIKKRKATVVGLSTLMTTTLPAMFETVQMIRKYCPVNVRIFIGGAVVSRKIADELGVFFAKDGIEMVRELKKGHI